MNTNALSPKRHLRIGLSAALLFCVHGALAAPEDGDAQKQAGALLMRGSVSRPSAVGECPVSSAGNHQIIRDDPQAQARRLLEGTSTLTHVPHQPLALVSTVDKK